MFEISAAAQAILDRDTADRRFSFVFDGIDNYQQKVDNDKIVFSETAMHNLMDFANEVDTDMPMVLDFSCAGSLIVIIYRKEDDGIWRLLTNERQAAVDTLFKAYGHYGAYTSFNEDFSIPDISMDEEVEEYIDNITDTLDHDFIEIELSEEEW